MREVPKLKASGGWDTSKHKHHVCLAGAVSTVSCLPTTLPGHEEASAAYSFLLNYATPFQETVLLWIPALVNAVTYGQDFLFLPYCFAMLLVQKYNIHESGWFQIMDSGLGKHHLNAALITACARLMNEPSILLWDFPPSSSLIQAYPTAQAHPTAQVCICRRGRCQHTSVCARLPAMLKETQLKCVSWEVAHLYCDRKNINAANWC